MVVNDLNFKAHKGGKSKAQIARETVQKVYDKGINHGSILRTDDETFKQIHRSKR